MSKSRLYFVTIPFLYIFLASPQIFYKFSIKQVVDKLPSSNWQTSYPQALIIPFISNNNDDKSERERLSTLKDQHNKHKRWYKHTIQYWYVYMLYRCVYVCIRDCIGLIQRWWDCRKCRSELGIRLYCEDLLLTLANIM